jgi:hypothetical protein
MAKPLVFSIDGAEIAFNMSKVDRSKLYGTKELEILDEAGEKCEMATLAEDGHTLIGRGGTGIGYLSGEGEWCDKASLQPVDLDGKTIQPVGSSFSAPIYQVEATTTEDYLSHSVRSIYAMSFENDHSIVERVRRGEILKFQYSYRGGLEFDTAFLLANEAGEVFMAVGSPTKIQFVGLQEAAGLADDEEDDADDGDDMDFGMI